MNIYIKGLISNTIYKLVYSEQHKQYSWINLSTGLKYDWKDTKLECLSIMNDSNSYTDFELFETDYEAKIFFRVPIDN